MRCHIKYICSWSTVPRSPTRPSTAKLKESDKVLCLYFSSSSLRILFRQEVFYVGHCVKFDWNFHIHDSFWNGDSLNIAYVVYSMSHRCWTLFADPMYIITMASPSFLVSLVKRGYSTPFFFTLDLTGFSFCCGSHPVIACVADGNFSAIP